ncbi:MAG: macro domain-containing protein [Hyphomonas sp.]|uniref:macro domain-containing protein n=1 Tax=Hyphomonas sp. TaxID=87 RepID=UPI003528228D
MPRLILHAGDLLEVDTDVIVNAANSSLLGGGGVDGAIHRAAGPALKEACRLLAPCPPGEVRVTEGFGLAPRLIFHTVGPIWQGGQRNEADILANCYRNCLGELSRRGLGRIAFPAISTGAYGYPAAAAARIAVMVCSRHPAAQGKDIVFAAFDPQNRAALASAMNALP